MDKSMNSATSKRFVLHTREEINEKRDNLIPMNTKRANVKAGRAFRAFLMERGDGTGPVDFENFDAPVLDECLSEFYFSARTLKGEKYSMASLINLRHSLSRYLKSPPFNQTVDIIKDAVFRESQEAFKGAVRELKVEGKGAIKHHPEIEDGDLNKLYQQMKSFESANPTELQEKVQFDIRLYFFRRGSENMHSMTKSTFAVQHTPEGDRYICQVLDELNKNHTQSCAESYTAFMPERKGDPKCPVESFIKYVSHLHPESDKLWTRPKPASSTSQIWYYNRAIGCDKLRGFMKDLSLKHGLSKIYSNHSIRVTGATILTRDSYASSQIKEVTGHKSVSSLAIYQRVSNGEKMRMGQSLTDKTLGVLHQPKPVLVNMRNPQASPAPPSFNTPSTSSSTTESDMIEYLDMDVESFLENFQHSSDTEPQISPSMPLPLMTTSAPVHAPATESAFSTPSTAPAPPLIPLPSMTTTPSASWTPYNGPAVSSLGRPATPPSSELQSIDFNLSPFLRDLLDDPEFETTQQLLVQTTARGPGNRGHQSSMMQQFHHASPNPRPTRPVIFSGCSNITINNLTINVQPR